MQPQHSMEKTDNNDVCVAWVWGTGTPICKEDMWIHSLTMPRFLTIKEGKLCQEVPENIKNEYAHLDIDSKRIKPEEDDMVYQPDR